MKTKLLVRAFSTTLFGIIKQLFFSDKRHGKRSLTGLNEYFGNEVAVKKSKLTTKVGFLKVPLAFLLLLIIGTTGCKDKVFKKHKVYSPVYTSYEDFRKESIFKSPKLITEKGNIYIKDQYIFITEPEKGIHFIDNSSPTSPQQIGFLELIGCTGLEIKGNRLYANSYIDLVVFDISSIQQPVELNRVKDAFPEALPQTEDDYPLNIVDKNRGVVIGWELETIKEEIENSSS